MQIYVPFAFETPHKNLEFQALYGDYIYANAPWIESDGYVDFVLSRSERMQIYLDNGAYENHESVSVKEYLSIIEALRPNVVVVPDVIGNRPATIRRVKEFFNAGPPSGPGAPKYMIVPQGGSNDEWVTCFHTLLRMYRHDFHLVGLPRKMYPSRLILARHVYNLSKKPLHLLGCVDPSEIAGILASNTPIASVDTSWPARKALGKTGPKDRIDFENDELDQDAFEAALMTFYDKIGLGSFRQMKPKEAENILVTHQEED